MYVSSSSRVSGSVRSITRFFSADIYAAITKRVISRPYSQDRRASLFALKQAIPNARISSDGDLDELADGINHFQQTCDVSPEEITLLIKGCDM